MEDAPETTGRIPITSSLFGKGFPAQAAALEFAQSHALRDPRRQVEAPHLTSVCDQAQDMLLAYHSYAADLTQQRGAEAKAANQVFVGSLLYSQQ